MTNIPFFKYLEKKVTLLQQGSYKTTQRNNSKFFDFMWSTCTLLLANLFDNKLNMNIWFSLVVTIILHESYYTNQMIIQYCYLKVCFTRLKIQVKLMKAYSQTRHSFKLLFLFFLFFSIKKNFCGYSLGVPQQDASNEYNNIRFHGGIRKIFFLNTPLIWSFLFVCVEVTAQSTQWGHVESDQFT